MGNYKCNESRIEYYAVEVFIIGAFTKSKPRESDYDARTRHSLSTAHTGA